MKPLGGFTCVRAASPEGEAQGTECINHTASVTPHKKTGSEVALECLKIIGQKQSTKFQGFSKLEHICGGSFTE